MQRIQNAAEAARARTARATAMNWALRLREAPRPYSANRKRAIDRTDRLVESHAERLADWETRQG